MRQDEELRKLTHIHVERTLRDGHIPEHAQCSQEVSSSRRKKPQKPLKHYNDVKAVGRAISWVYSSCNAPLILTGAGTCWSLLAYIISSQQLWLGEKKQCPIHLDFQKRSFGGSGEKTSFSSGSSPSALLSLSNPRHLWSECQICLLFKAVLFISNHGIKKPNNKQPWSILCERSEDLEQL